VRDIFSPKSIAESCQALNFLTAPRRNSRENNAWWVYIRLVTIWSNCFSTRLPFSTY